MKFRKLLGVALLSATLSSCATIEELSEGLEQMPEAEFRDLALSTHNLARAGGELLSPELSEENRVIVYQVAHILAETVMNDNLSSTDDALSLVLGQLKDSIDDERVVSVLEDVINLLDGAIGQVKIGLDGLLTLRQKTLLMNVLEGFSHGVSGTD
jgi:hypothetical protein